MRQRAYDGILETLVFKEEINTERHYWTSNQPVLGTPPTIYEASVDAKTGKIKEVTDLVHSKFDAANLMDNFKGSNKKASSNTEDFSKNVNNDDLINLSKLTPYVS